MNDEMKGKSGKVKVMYVCSDDDFDKCIYNLCIGKGGGCLGKFCVDGGCCFVCDDKQSQFCDCKWEDLLWCMVFCVLGDEMLEKVDYGGISGKSFIDLEVLCCQCVEEICVYGENVCQVFFQSCLEVIVCVWFIQSVMLCFKEVLCWMVVNCKVYYVVDEVELIKVLGMEYYGGVCFLIKKCNGIIVQQWVSQVGVQDCVLVLENEFNLYNLGGMMCSCVYFGVKGVVVQDVVLLELGVVICIVEGGVEYVQLIIGDNIVNVLDDFRQVGYIVVIIFSEQGKLLFKISLLVKMVLVLGQEYEGLLDVVCDLNDLCVKIDGMGNVVGLNIFVVIGVLFGEWWCQNKV